MESSVILKRCVYLRRKRAPRPQKRMTGGVVVEGVEGGLGGRGRSDVE